MTITHDIDMDLLRPGVRPVVCAVQGEAVSRALCFHLTQNTLAWTVPEGVEALIRFGKPDGTGGVYDTLPGGTAACTVAANTVTAVLAPQVLTCPGKVALQLQLRQNQQVLATFGVWLLVEEDPAAGEWASEDYYNQIDVRIRGIFLAEPEAYQANRTSGQIAKMADGGMAPVFVLDGCLLDYVERRSDEAGHGPCVFERLYQEGGRVYVRRVLVDDEGSVDFETEALSESSEGGLNAAAAALLIGILRNGVFTSDQSANISALEAALASGESGDSGDAHRHSYADGVCVVCGAADPDAESGGNDSSVSAGGVGSINWLLKNATYGADDVNNTWGSSTTTHLASRPSEPDNGYLVCTTAAESLATYAENAVYVCWPLVGGKTYRITLANADTAQVFINLFAGKLNEMPVKGEISAVEGELVKAIVSYNAIAANAAKEYTYTPSDNEWLFIKPGKANVLTITAEVTV